MKVGRGLLVLCVGAFVGACAAGTVPDNDAQFRCAGGDGAGAGLIGLSNVDLNGTIDVTTPADSGAVHANDHIDLNGSVTIDSDIYSAGDVTINGSGPQISGDVVEGVGDVSADLPNTAANYAYTNNNDDLLVLDDGNGGTVPAVVDGQLRLSGGDDLTMPGGNYYFENGMSVSGQASIDLLGPVTIYVAGTVSFSGTTTTNNAASYTMDIIQMSDADVNISGTCSAELHIFAPLSDVSISGTTNFNGTVLGNNISVSGTANIGLTGDAVAYNSDGGCHQDPGGTQPGSGLPDPSGGTGPTQDPSN